LVRGELPMQFDRKPEILAPAGTLDAAKMVIDAGADAVYIGGKALNMRQHRTSYNLSDVEVAEAIEFVHSRGARLYFTLNSLVLDSQLQQVRRTLEMLGTLCPDAVIVQDLAVATLAREICVHLPLHASTMLNIHNTESALALKMMGFKRVITSRDIPLHEVRRIGEGSGLEMEYFVHGDMCISQSSQCYISGILFGESSNCGRCMKPCRWKWKLVTKRGKVEFPGQTEGYLLARKDVSLLQHIPALIQNGIASLKIEGRMRTGEFLAPIVTLYRNTVDAYFADPVNYAMNAQDMEDLFSRRVREYTTAHSYSNPGLEGVDPSGSREPRFFSYNSPEPTLTVGKDIDPQPLRTNLELIVHVSGPATAEAAVKAGADAVYLCGEGFVLHNGKFALDRLQDFVKRASEKDVRVAVTMPHICDLRDMAEWKHWIAKLSSIRNLAIGVSNLGGIQLAKANRIREIIVDFPLNITNSIAADELSTMGATRITASVELNYEQLCVLMKSARLPVEVIGQGPVTAMLLEHCVLAGAAGTNPQGICPMYCRKGAYVLQDASAYDFPLECDRRCRNHIFTATDVCVLPNLSLIASAGISGIRVEGQLDRPSTIEIVTRIYRKAIDSLKAGETPGTADELEEIRNATGRPLSDGPFDFQAVPAEIKEHDFVTTQTNRP
jgi:putative protease